MNDDLITKLQQSKKYRGLQIPPETIHDLISQESKRYNNKKDVERAVRQKLHQIMALYLGDPDYAQSQAVLEGLESAEELDSFAKDMLSYHTSTKERLPYLRSFYETIFNHTGLPKSILDLACGLNPFAIGKMGLSKDINYTAFDIHAPRVQLIDAFFKKTGYFNAQAVQQDILVSPPTEKADVAFFFKEAHRMDQRQKGSTRILCEALHVDHLLISLPNRDIKKTHDLSQKMEKLVLDTIAGFSWEMETITFEDELVFCIHKGEPAS